MQMEIHLGVAVQELVMVMKQQLKLDIQVLWQAKTILMSFGMSILDLGTVMEVSCTGHMVI
jgi:hypothetical protein